MYGNLRHRCGVRGCFPSQVGGRCNRHASRAILFGHFCRLNCRNLQPGRHFGPFLSAQLPSPAAEPSFFAIFVGSTVVACSRAILFGHFCRLNCRHLRPSHHFLPFLSAQLSSPAAKPSFSAIFVGSTVAACSRAIIFGHFCRLNCRHLQPGHHFRPFLSSQLSSSAAGQSFSALFVGSTATAERGVLRNGIFCVNSRQT